MPRTRPAAVVECSSSQGKLVIAVEDSFGRPCDSVEVTATHSGGSSLKTWSRNRSGVAVAHFGLVGRGTYTVSCDGALENPVVAVAAGNPHSNRNPHATLVIPAFRVSITSLTPLVVPREKPVDLRYRINDPSALIAKARIEITDARGQTVHARDLQAAELTDGYHDAKPFWDGVCDDGTDATIGGSPYRVELVATGGDSMAAAMRVRRSDRRIIVRFVKARIWIMQGLHSGNQSAALALIRNLRRLAFDLPIEVAADPAPQLYEASLEMTLYLQSDVTDEKSLRDLIAAKLAQLPNLRSLEETGSGEWTGFFCPRPDQFDYTSYRPNPATERNYWPPTGHLKQLGDEIAADTRIRRLVLAWHEPDTGFRDSLTFGGIASGAKTIHGRVTFVSISEPSITSKLREVHPRYDEAFPHVTWVPQDRFDQSANALTMGFIASGEVGDSTVLQCCTTNLKTRWTIVLQPLAWHPEQRYVVWDRTGGKSDQPSLAFEALGLPEDATYFDVRLDPSQFGAFAKDLFTTEPAAPWIDLHGHLTSGQFDVLSCYGLHQCDESAEVVLANTWRAIAAGMKQKRLKKTIVFAVYVRPVIWDALQEITKEARVAAIDFDETVRDRIAAFANNQAQDILFIHRWTVPPFEIGQLIHQSSTLPVLVSASNTGNLLKMIGQPHLPMGRAYVYTDVPGMDAPRKRLEACRRAINDPSSSEVGLLAELFVETAASSGEALGGYFAKVKDLVTTPDRDQLRVALARLLRKVRSE